VTAKDALTEEVPAYSALSTADRVKSVAEHAEYPGRE